MNPEVSLSHTVSEDPTTCSKEPTGWPTGWPALYQRIFSADVEDELLHEEWPLDGRLPKEDDAPAGVVACVEAAALRNGWVRLTRILLAQPYPLSPRQRMALLLKLVNRGHGDSNRLGITEALLSGLSPTQLPHDRAQAHTLLQACASCHAWGVVTELGRGGWLQQWLQCWPELNSMFWEQVLGEGTAPFPIHISPKLVLDPLLASGLPLPHGGTAAVAERILKAALGDDGKGQQTPAWINRAVALMNDACQRGNDSLLTTETGETWAHRLFGLIPKNPVASEQKSLLRLFPSINWTSSDLHGTTPLHALLCLPRNSKPEIERWQRMWVRRAAISQVGWDQTDALGQTPWDSINIEGDQSSWKNVLIGEAIRGVLESQPKQKEEKPSEAQDGEPGTPAPSLGTMEHTLHALALQENDPGLRWVSELMQASPVDEVPKALGCELTSSERCAFWRAIAASRKWAYYQEPTENPAPPPPPPDTSPSWVLYSKEALACLARSVDEETDDDNLKAFRRIQKIAKERTINGEGRRPLASADGVSRALNDLLDTFPHFEEVVTHIRDHAVLQSAGDGTFWIPPLLLLGGPGIGKTFFLSELARLVETDFRLIGMEGMSGGFILSGLSSTWSNGKPGLIFQHAFDAKTANPIVLLDEVDKANRSGDARYPPDMVLLPVLEPQTAGCYRDEFIDLPLDLRKVIWVASANDVGSIYPPLYSRFDVISVPNPDRHARRSLTRGVYRSLRQAQSWGPKADERLPEAFLDALVDRTTTARDTRRLLNTAVARAFSAGRTAPLPVDLPGTVPPPKAIWDQTAE